MVRYSLFDHLKHIHFIFSLYVNHKIHFQVNFIVHIKHEKKI